MKQLPTILFAALLSLSANIYAENIEYVNSTLYAGSILSLKYHGGYFYGTGYSALEIFAVSDNGELSLESGYPLSGPTLNVDVFENYAYVAAYDNGLYIVNISSLPISLEPTNFPTPGEVMDVVVRDSLAYIADGYAGLLIANVSDPANPFQVSSLALGNEAISIQIDGDYLFIMMRNNVFNVIDISDPAQPEVVNITYTEHNLTRSRVYGLYLFVLEYWEEPMVIYSNLLIYSIANQESPQLISSYFFDSQATDIFLQNNLAYVANDWLGISILDISDPGAPIILSVYSNEDEYSYYSVCGFDNRLLIGGWKQLQAIDISAPQNPEWLDSYHIPVYLDEIFIYEGFAYLPTFEAIQLVDIRDCTNPEWYSRYDDSFWGDKMDVFVKNDYAYVVAGFGPLYIINVADPLNPYEEGYYRDPDNLNQTFGVFVVDTLAYVAMRPQGFHIVNVADPQNPVKISDYNVNGFLRKIYVEGDFAYLLTSHGLDIFNISDPAAPELVGSFYTTDSAHGLAIVNNLAFTTDEQSIFYAIDISVPADPTLLGVCSIPSEDETNYAEDIAVEGNFAYLACSGVQIIDISNPAEPIHVDSWQLARSPQGIAVDNGYIFYADKYSLTVLHHEQSGLELPLNTPKQFSLSPNYPNPFNASTTIKYNLPKSSEVTLDIYDILGRKVQTLFNDFQPAGQHAMIWQAKDLSSGMYFYKLTVGEFEQASKMTLLK